MKIKEFYVGERLIDERGIGLLELYEKVLGECYHIDEIIYSEILPKIIKETPRLRLFLLIHSSFSIHNSDKLERFMIEELSDVTLEEMQSYCGGNRLTSDIMERYADFDPVSDEDADHYAISVTYKLYHDRKRSAPIDLDLLDWPKVKEFKIKGINSEAMIERQTILTCGA